MCATASGEDWPSGNSFGHAFLEAGLVEPSDKEWRDVQTALLAGEAWIADGNYHETLDLRLAADTVVYLDTHWCVWFLSPLAHQE